MVLDCTPEQPILSKECEAYAIPPGSCEDGKPISLTFMYTGDDCSASNNPQNGKAKCSGDPAGAQPVELVYTGKKAGKFTISPPGEVINVGDEVTITTSDKFESNTKLEIRQGGSDIQKLEIHTSCSQPLAVGDQFGSLKLVQFIPKDGVQVTENVIYTYKVTNNGASDVTVDVYDDQLGDIASGLGVPAGETVTLTAGALLSDPGTVTNTVTVTDTTDPDCQASDSAVVEVVPPPVPPATCDELKPIDALILEYDASQAGGKGIASVAWYRDKYDPNDPSKNLINTTGPVADGAVVSFDGFAAADAKNDVDFFITFANGDTATSRFHRSCSDDEMNDISDCGSLQGDGKDNNSGLNTWILRDLAGNGKVLGCP